MCDCVQIYVNKELSANNMNDNHASDQHIVCNQRFACLLRKDIQLQMNSQAEVDTINLRKHVVHIHVHVYTHTHTYMYVCMYIHIYVYI